MNDQPIDHSRDPEPGAEQEGANLALLPAGLRDLLPPEAEAEAQSVEAMLEVFATHGYQRISPPMLEYEASLLAGSGQAVGHQIFRVLDPHSHRMMGLRADITPQVARIATTRLAAAPRPLRLSYAGQCLRIRGQQLAPDRQLSQVGIELIGPDSVAADAELVAVAAEALAAIGLQRISLDLTMPALIPALLADAGLDVSARRQAIRALDRKDAAAVRGCAGPAADTLIALLLSAGRAERALATLAASDLPPAARALAERLSATVDAIAARAPGLALTIDPVEFRGFGYHTGISMTVYAPGRHEELGRGGRYLSGEGEQAAGLTLYADAVLRAAPVRQPRPAVYVPHGSPAAEARRLRAQGMAAVAGLGPVPDDAAEARRLGCTLLLRGETLQRLDEE